MRLTRLFIRFYKSFNYDYLRKYNKNAKPQPWEMIENKWYPYVKISIEPKVTTVVGANESGKSHLLTAIEKGISGKNIERKDFCRYSQFFSLEKNQLKYPDFGFEWTHLSDGEITVLREVCQIPDKISFNLFLLFRTNGDKITIYIPNKSDYDYTSYNINPESYKNLAKILPRVTRINADIAIPETVPIQLLADQPENFNKYENLSRINRKRAYDLLEEVINLKSHFSNHSTVANGAKQIYSIFSPYADTSINGENLIKPEALELARSLICDIAKIDPLALSELYEAIQNNKEGFVSGIIQKINNALHQNLNFPKCWSQDRDFRLVVSPREYELAFTIRDRTGTEYSFDERSSGLKYFLSYYTQYCTHKPNHSSEILLMDEPDAYLSSQAQQDLLKIFENFADQGNDSAPIQVIYVTHSPFLINKNHAERIRVLEKGTNEEGTRVVKDAAKNHYEPLRSAFGAFVGETTFIGNCNLFVEGITDQILLAGASKYLRDKGISILEILDLNHITIVPAGSANHIPYLVYLARGRDVEQPAVIVLLDSDESGNDAKKQLKKGGARQKQILDEKYILQIGDLEKDGLKTNVPNHKLIEIEDMIPIPICLDAARKYLKEICEAEDHIVDLLTKEKLLENFNKNETLFKALEHSVKEISNEEIHIEKMGFARNVVTVINEKYKNNSTGEKLAPELKEFEEKFTTLFKKLNMMGRDAERQLFDKKLSERIHRSKNSFLADHPQKVKKENAYLFLEEIETILDDSLESDHIKTELRQIRREFKLDQNQTELINNYEKFKESIERIKYAGKINSQEQEADN